MLLLVRLTLLILIFAGCDSTINASRLDNDLANTTWIFERAETDDGDVSGASVSSRTTDINFGGRDDNADTYSVSGYNGCNAFSGKYDVDGSEIVFTQMLQTERACQEHEARIEEVFNRGILNARSFSIDGDQLVIDAPSQSVKLRLNRLTTEE